MELRDAIDTVRAAVLQVIGIVPSGAVGERRTLTGRQRDVVLGTAFFVSDEGFAVTAWHVVEVMHDRRLFPADSEFGVGLAIANSESRRANFVVTRVDLVDRDEQHDLALVKLRQNPFRGELRSPINVGGYVPPLLYDVPRIRVERPRDGDPIAISGYPLSEAVLVTTSGNVASSWSLATWESPHPRIPGETLSETRDIYLADVQTNPGNSGGPVYAIDDGSVVGVLVAGKLTSVHAGEQPAIVGGVPLLADAGLSIVTPARYLTELLDRNGVAYTASS